MLNYQRVKLALQPILGLLICFFIQFGHLVGAMATHPFFVSLLMFCLLCLAWYSKCSRNEKWMKLKFRVHR
jgi:hypothetical protein